ncbi:MAG: hypothetical protein DI547_04500 [Sphingobium sp.]|nr:MAG: hypothetical protein DI547_04500 [Sphingobium sp.]
MEVALTQPLDAALHALISDRLADAIACGVEHMTHLIVVEPGDGESDFQREAAFSPFHNPLSETRFGDPDFFPGWDWAGRHDGWFEWFTIVGNDGFAFVVLVPDAETIDPTLLAMLREHAPCD